MSDETPNPTAPVNPPVNKTVVARAPKTATVRIKYDTWIGDERIAAPAVIELPMDRAKELLASGKAERADPLPGE